MAGRINLKGSLRFGPFQNSVCNGNGKSSEGICCAAVSLNSAQEETRDPAKCFPITFSFESGETKSI